MTIRIDTPAVRRAGRLMVADADELAATAARVTAPDTGHAVASVETVLTMLTTRASGIAGRMSANGHELGTVTEMLLALDELIGAAIRWE